MEKIFYIIHSSKVNFPENGVGYKVLLHLSELEHLKAMRNLPSGFDFGLRIYHVSRVDKIY